MSLDFTLDKYADLCRAIRGTYEPKTVLSYLTEPTSERTVVLRHDVDRKPKNAVKMARLESVNGITSTYYFRMKEGVFMPELIAEIADLGHEIGYHYEVLDKANGDPIRAIQMFTEELSTFRGICDVRTICMHGNPLSQWLNRDLWKTYDFRDYGIIGEPYLSIDFTKFLYLTDTGRSWNSPFNVKDRVDARKNKVVDNIRNTDDIITLIQRKELDCIFILTHPNRWHDTTAAWLMELVCQSVKNIGKAGILKIQKHNY